MNALSGLSMGSMYQFDRIDCAANKLIERKDKDGDGLLSAMEFGGPPEQFDRMDTSGDGQADRDEIIAFLPRPLFNRLAAQMIRQQDTDNSKTLSIDEMGISDAVFQQIDTNEDGEIDRRELGRFLSELSGDKGPSHTGHAKGGGDKASSTDDEGGTEEETVVQIDTDQDGQADAEQVTTFIPQLNIYQTTTTYLANAGRQDNNDPLYL